jgi:hypothetical protein
LFQAVGWLLRAGQRNERLLAAFCYGLINVAGLVLIALGFNGLAYVWMAPAWISLHAFAVNRVQQ